MVRAMARTSSPPPSGRRLARGKSRASWRCKQEGYGWDLKVHAIFDSLFDLMGVMLEEGARNFHFQYELGDLRSPVYGKERGQYMRCEAAGIPQFQTEPF